MNLDVSSSFGCADDKFIRINGENEKRIQTGVSEAGLFLLTEADGTVEIVSTDPDTQRPVLTQRAGTALLVNADTQKPYLNSGYIPFFRYTDYSFEDCPDHVDAINYVCDNGIMEGIADGCFGIDETASMVTAISAIYNMAGTPEAGYGGTTFRDVLPVRDIYPAVNWGLYTGVVMKTDGIGGLLRPYRDLTLGKALTFLWRYNKWCSSNSGDELYYDSSIEIPSDYNSGNYEADCIHWALSNGLIESLPDAEALEGTVDRKNLALYIALYCQNVEGLRESDRHGYDNEAENFVSTDSYLLSQEHYDKYLSFAESGSHAKYLYDILESSHAPISHSSGMALTAALDKLGKISYNENAAGNTNSVASVPLPTSLTDFNHVIVEDALTEKEFTLAESIISYYHLTWNTIGAQHSDLRHVSPTPETLKKIVEEQQDGGISILSYTFISSSLYAESGHTVVLTGHPVLVDGYYEIEIYDPDNRINASTLLIAEDFKTCTVLGNQKVTPIKIAYLDGSNWEVFDIDGEHNILGNSALITKPTTRTVSNAAEAVTDDTWIFVSSLSDFFITNAEGESLEYTHYELRGNLEILSEYYIENGFGEAVTIALKLRGRQSRRRGYNHRKNEGLVGWQLLWHGGNLRTGSCRKNRIQRKRSR